ncbi:uncharacterized protein M437DRAFT_71553 [Aureobasidium melanogenum CBS 110374]|uniref:Uncharacterized protein n=1 Tax=Aureobasidium melanogenum (strain CBS 110374) TaxID=1043003 RepID=A0A074W854_AURM1|nr:uncharacterized protein M437DRAFT_71553 [Aureobasidium melanogenum CBS 110374]KEQ67764.1 hypothetical protein M437DRAFT_71553 [Aureobasidium melanogenum CBS 110374]
MRSRFPLESATTSVTSPLQYHDREPLASKSTNYHTSPAVKSMLLEPKDVQGNNWQFKVTVQAEQMPPTAKSTTRTQLISLNDTENTQVPDLCPVSQLGDHASTDYSLSEIDFHGPEDRPQSGHHPAAIDSLSPEPVRPLVSRRTPVSARLGSSRNQFGSSIRSAKHRVEPEVTDGPQFEQDDEADAALGACAPGDATMLESEEFSMISVDSLPSRVAGHSSPSQALQSTEGEASVNRSYMPSSPPAFIANRATPVPEDSTPENPKAPQPSQSHDIDISTPLRESARKSGRALQDALNGPFRESVSRELPSTRESIFNGFSSGTRRQLQQSLRAGQSLASPSAMQNVPRLAPNTNALPNYLSPFHSPVRQQETFDSLPARMLTPNTDDRSHSSASIQAQSTVEYPELAQESRRTSQAGEEPEMSYIDVQRASASHMQSPPRSSPASEHNAAEQLHDNIIEPEAEEDGDDDKDIWQEEASRSLIDEQGSPEQPDLFLDNLVVKPRRSKLPGTLRRTSGASSAYSDPPAPQGRQNRKVSASTMGSRKSSGVMTPPSSDDGSVVIVGRSSEQLDSPAKVAADEDLSQSESGDDTGMFFQSNLPSIYNGKARKPVADSAKSSFAPSSPLRNTFLEISPEKNIQNSQSSANQNLSAGPSPLRRSLVNSSNFNDSQIRRREDKIDTSETQTDSSLASDAQQIQREMRGKSSRAASTISSLTSGSQARGSRGPASANTIDLTISDSSEQDVSTISSRSRSYQEELNLDSPMRVKVNFNDDTGNSTLLEPKRQYPPLFDNVPTLTKPTKDSPGDSQPKSPLLKLTESFWEAVTKPPVYASPERKPAVMLESAPVATVPDHVLRLRRKYGLLPDTHPFIYAHIRTLHRMLNSTRSRSGSSIVPRSGPLGHGLSRLLGKSRTNELDQRFVWTQTHLHVVDSFMSLLLPQEERDRLQHRGRDSKGRYGDEVVFNGVKDVLADIKRVAEMLARAERMEI